MDLETTIAITSTKEAEQEQLAKVLVHPDIEQLQSTKNCKDSIKKTQKRKSPNQASSTKDSDNSAGARSAEQSEVTPTDCNAFQHIRKEEHRKIELNHPPKRPKTGFKSSASGRTDKTKQCGQKLSLKTKTDQSKEGKSKMSVDPVYFEMTPFQSQPCLLPTQPPLDYNVQLNNDSERVLDGKERDTAAVADEEFPSNHSSISVSRISLRGTNLNTCINNQRRTCRVHSRTIKGEEVTNSSKDDSDLDTAGTHASKDDLSRCLLRSYSCPEILSLCSLDRPWTSLHPTIKVHPSHQQHSSHSALAQQPRRSLCRARRHTVCSLEVEREIAPLCLRKEVYPSRRSIPYDGASLALSPSTSLSALASCFLSSPLLVQKHEERGKVSSIRIRKTLPKPQNNLTPMGLPRPIRLKKKEFSLEEIYTNKNFSKPPESRLETIFEVPLNRRNGSESWFGQRRVKRFLEFLDVGKSRKPKKPLAGIGKAGISSSRTRRGGFPKDEPSLSAQDVDSLLCAKLDQLSLWLTHDQKDPNPLPPVPETQAAPV
uniref:Tantalus-like domain-containing protein n=1 Tax=Mola mola TaxID=94237 RepID=A0A3Q3X3H7_MOLML